MKFRLINEKPKTFVVVFQTDDQVVELLQQLARELRLVGSRFGGIGALNGITVGVNRL